MYNVKARLIRYLHIFTQKTKALRRKFNQHDSSELAYRELFDELFYLKAYPDIAAAGVNPLSHFLEVGLAEGRLPLSPQCPDSSRRIQNALEIDPANGLAIQLKLTIELGCSDLYAINNTLNWLTQTLPPEKIESYHSLLEKAAIEILLRRYWHGDANHFSDISTTLQLFSTLCPKSVRIKCALALSTFRLNKFDAASKHLAEIPVIPPELVGLVDEAYATISEANKVNHPPPSRSKLLLLDSSFPSKISSFRYGEFKTYLETIENSSIHVLPENMIRYGELLPFSSQVEKFLSSNKISANRLRHFDKDFIGEPKVAYCVFLNLADYFYSQIGLPSAEHLLFTLYPGGGFNLNDKVADQKLQRLCDNPKLSKIITTQNVSYRYLVDGGFCSPEQIQHIYGGIIPHIYNSESVSLPSKRLNKPLDVCFVAQRYSAIGAEKGYDVFINVVKRFANSPDIQFHVVGGFDELTIPLGPTRNIKFYGAQPASFFDDFYNQMDLILSPNIHASALDPNQPDAFDGFPTTAVVEAGLRNVAIFLTDFMGMNQHLDGSSIFKNNEVKIIDRDPDSICQLIYNYLLNREALRELGEAGRRAILREFSYEVQMQPRINLLRSYLSFY